MKKLERRTRKQDLVYDALRRDILEGRLPPGSRLTIDTLAQDLGVSHIPVREALTQLQADGYVRLEPYVGATVAELEPDWIREVFELTSALEVVAVRAACERMSDEDIGGVGAWVASMDGLVTDAEAWSEANIRLHEMICERAGMGLTKRVLSQVLDQWDRLRSAYLSSVSALRLDQAQAEHHEIVRALSERDAKRAAALIVAHNGSAYAAYADYLGIARSAPRT